MGSGLAFITAPPADFVPEPVRGHPSSVASCVTPATLRRARESCAPLREFGPPALDVLGPMPYVAVQHLITEANPPGRRNYWTADFLAELPDKAVDVFVEHANEPVSPTARCCWSRGGAIARVPDDATAFGQRNAPWNIHYLSMWEDPADDEKNIAYARAIAGAMKPWTTGAVYLNYIGDEGLHRVEAAFGGEVRRGSRQLKAEWDPDNVFRHNQNIKPA